MPRPAANLPRGPRDVDELPAVGPVTGPARLTELAELLRSDSPESGRFLRGLAVGALIGAVIAGLAALRRRPRG